MKLSTCRRLEAKLSEAEDELLEQDVFGAKGLEIRDKLRDLVTLVIAERIRAELVEGNVPPEMD